MSRQTTDMDGFTAAQRVAIALTLRDLGGWGTLYGLLVRFDAETGERLWEPVKRVGEYDRTPRRDLPANWVHLFIERGWLDLTRVAVGYDAWTPTEEGRRVRDAWLPDHLKNEDQRADR